MTFQIDSDAMATLLGRSVELVRSPGIGAFLKNKRVLISGAGGSIGSEIVRQLKQLGVHDLYYLDNDEYALYTLNLSLEGSAMLDSPRYILGSVFNRVKVASVFKEVRPDVVFHAAACKHLPLTERSPEAAILTNVMGTDIIASACVEHEVPYFVNVSTDKAANPTSVLGITKRIAEMITVKSNSLHTRTASVRFGNVLASRGSYLETLAYQIDNGLVTELTHPEATRYFMTIPEASELVIEAARLAEGGETFVLDMGESVKIVDMIERFANYRRKPVPIIEYSKLRKGEKIREVLYDSSETHAPTTHPRVSKVTVDHLDIDIEEIRMVYLLAQSGESADTLKEYLQRVVEKNPAVTSNWKA